MIQHLKHLLIGLMAIAFVSCNGKRTGELPRAFQLIPQPSQVEMLSGKGLSTGELSAMVLEGFESRPEVNGPIAGIPVQQSEGTGTLRLVLDPALTDRHGREGYELRIQKGTAEVHAAAEAGIFYGCQTLNQLLEDAADHDLPVPACRITDHPALEYRAVHIDVKHHLDHMDYYYKSIDRLARYKINAVIFEIEDKLQFTRRPIIGAPQAIPIEEMAKLTRYAAERHIEISPLVNGLGHATFILKHPEYEYLREIPQKTWVSCSMEPGVYELYADLFKDAFEATPGARYLHIGGDEIGDVGLCDRCRDSLGEIGEFGLYMHWLNNICDLAEAAGRTPILWDDMPLKMAGVYRSTYDINHSPEQVERDWAEGEEKLDSLIGLFPRNCVYMRWNYEQGTLPGNIRVLDWYHDNELQSMISTAAQTDAVLFPKDEQTGSMSDGGISAIRSFVGLAAEKGIKGMFCTAWDDNSPHFETYWRGLIASAEYSWSPEKKSLEEFDIAYLQREYGLQETDYALFYSKLTAAASFWGRALNPNGYRYDPRNALLVLPGLAHWIPESEKDDPEKGIDYTERIIALPDASDLGAWTEMYAERLAEAGVLVSEYETTSAMLARFENESTRNPYHWKLFGALNDFQVTAPALLLALRDFDGGPTAGSPEAIAAIEEQLAAFDAAWENLKLVYSETRYIAYPESHVPDRYFHFASQREDLSWMIQVEELLHPMLREWIAELN